MTMRRVISVVLCLSLICASCARPDADRTQAVAPEIVRSEAHYKKVYVIAPGDRIDVDVRGQEAARVTDVLVRPDGFISLPTLDDVQAAGLTYPQLDAKLTQALSHRLINPEVTVMAKSVREPMVYVFGEVAKPTAVPLSQARTVAQAISYSGGFSRSANKQSLALIRLNNAGELQAFKIPVGVEGQPGPLMAMHAVAVQADDIILVPETGISQFDRWVADYVGQPLAGVNAVLAPIANFLLIRELIEDDDNNN